MLVICHLDICPFCSNHFCGNSALTINKQGICVDAASAGQNISIANGQVTFKPDLVKGVKPLYIYEADIIEDKEAEDGARAILEETANSD